MTLAYSNNSSFSNSAILYYKNDLIADTQSKMADGGSHAQNATGIGLSVKNFSSGVNSVKKHYQFIFFKDDLNELNYN